MFWALFVVGHDWCVHLPYSGTPIAMYAYTTALEHSLRA